MIHSAVLYNLPNESATSWQALGTVRKCSQLLRGGKRALWVSMALLMSHLNNGTCSLSVSRAIPLTELKSFVRSA